ncbi:hypothetical protein [Georgenia faecalis]|uniref:WXG100 family type VII secretion target n=1 Tax=Georgenia faecalis TaxID=2483799 RepID=A0ABV9D7C8_9MICO|nr:hypothetical protein [Georgenia faecalis]
MSGATALPLPEGTPGSLTAVSSDLVRVDSRVDQTLIAQHGASSPVISSSWKGGAAESRAAEANTLRARLTSASDRLPTIGTALTTYGEKLATTIEKVRRWQRKWDEAQETYTTLVRRLRNEPDEEGFDKQAVADKAADDRDAEHERLKRLYTDAMDELTAAGKTAATTVRGQCDLVVPEGNADSRNEVGAHLLRDLPLSGGEAMSELAKDVAPELADDLRKVVESNDPDKIAAFLEEYEQYADDPYFAQAVMSELEAEGLMETFTDLAIVNASLAGQDDKLGDQQQALLSMLGTMYATASGPAEGDVDPHGYNFEGINEWRDEVWFPSLTESGRTDYEFANDSFAGGHFDGYWAQGQLLAAATQAGVSPGVDFMEHVGVDLVEWDRENGGYEDYRSFNHGPTGMTGPDFFDYGDRDSMRAFHANDPVWALLESASQHEETTQALLMSDVSAKNGDQSIVDYLVRERGGSMETRMPFPDGGKLLAETVAEYGTDRSDEASTALAAQYLNAYVDTVGSGEFANGEKMTDNAFAEGRTGTADVISAHIEDFIRATDSPDVSNSPFSEELGRAGDPTSYRVNFDEETSDHFAQMFGDLALDRPDEVVTSDNPDARDNPPALQRVFNAALAHNATALHEGYASPDGDPMVAMDRGAGFLVHLTESAGHGRVESAEAQDAYNEYLREVLDSGAGLVPVGSIPVVGGVADAAYGLGTDAILDRIIDTDHATRQEVSEAEVGQNVRKLLEDQATMAVIENGAWEEGKDPVTWAADRGLSDSQTFVRDGQLMPIEEILADPDRQAAFFDHYLREPDGGAGVIRELTDQIEEAVGSGSVRAEDDYKAGG